MILRFFIVCQGHVLWGNCEVVYVGVFVSTPTVTHIPILFVYLKPIYIHILEL